MGADARIAGLERRNRDLAAIRAVAMAGRELELDRLMPELLRIAAEATESDRAAFLMLSPDGGTLELAATFGYTGPLEEKYRRFPIAPSPTAAATFALTPRAMSLGDWPEAIRSELLSERFIEVALVPLHIERRPAGSLNLARTTARPYTEEELASAAAIAEQIAAQIERARLYAEANRRVKLLSLSSGLARLGAESRSVAELVDGVLAEITTALGADGAILHLLEGDRLVLAGRRTPVVDAMHDALTEELRAIPLSYPAVVARAAAEKRTILLELCDAERDASPIARMLGARHLAATPLVVKGRLLGGVSVLRRHDPAFAEDEVHALELCAAHAASLIEGTRLVEQERRRAHDLSVINEVGRLIAEQLDLETVLSQAVRQLARIAEVPQTFLVLCDGDDLRMAATNLEDTSVLDIVIRPGEESLARLAIEQRAPVVVHDAMSDGRVNRTRTLRFDQHALLAVPLIARGQPFGAALLGDTSPERRFTPEQVERAAAVTNQLATAIANAKLFEDLRRSYEELERAQQQLVQRERLAALGELAAVVAHEVRNPLAVIFNSVASLRHAGGDADKTELLLSIVGEEAKRLNRIVGDLLEFARPGLARVERAPLEPLLTGAAESAASALGTPAPTVQIEVVPPLPPVPLDAHLVRQALVNLIVNAMQATPEGAVRVRASSEQLDGRPFARIDVADDGPGIDPSIAAQMFQPFFTTKARGTGLGLAIVRRVADAHHGDISVATGAGGTTFTLRLPLEG